MNFLRELTLDWDGLDPDNYLLRIPSFKNLSTLSLDAPLIFFTGENGSGKSTLLEAFAVACGFNAEGGSINYRFSTKNTHSDLYNHLRIVRNPKKNTDGFFLRAESFYNVATALDEIEEGSFTPYQSYGKKSLHEQSHGESFMSLMQNRFSGNGIYLLDEPEAALSAQRQLSLLLLIHDLIEKGSQLIIATHSLILLGYPNATILEFSEEGIQKIPYEKTSSYIINDMVLNNHETMLAHLFDKKTED